MQLMEIIPAFPDCGHDFTLCATRWPAFTSLLSQLAVKLLLELAQLS